MAAVSKSGTLPGRLNHTRVRGFKSHLSPQVSSNALVNRPSGARSLTGNHPGVTTNR